MGDDKKEEGWLSKAFWGAAKLVTIGLVSAVAWQIFLDPIFFPIFHDPTNTTAQAFVSMINTTFDWIPDLIGLTGDGGLLNTEFAQGMLEPYMDQVAYTPASELVAQTSSMPDGGFSLDMF